MNLLYSPINYIYINSQQLVNFSPLTLKKCRESYFSYSHGISGWEKGFSTNSEKQLRLATIHQLDIKVCGERGSLKVFCFPLCQSFTHAPNSLYLPFYNHIIYLPLQTAELPTMPLGYVKVLNKLLDVA